MVHRNRPNKGWADQLPLHQERMAQATEGRVKKEFKNIYRMDYDQSTVNQNFEAFQKKANLADQFMFGQWAGMIGAFVVIAGVYLLAEQVVAAGERVADEWHDHLGKLKDPEKKYKRD